VYVCVCVCVSVCMCVCVWGEGVGDGGRRIMRQCVVMCTLVGFVRGGVESV
jgi:hypothetical protein